MVIDQRNAGASVTPTNGALTLDRWQAYQSVASKFSIQQDAGSITPPSGFTDYLGATSLSAYSVSSSDYFSVQQNIEGYNISDLGFGTANAKTTTLSFWVRSSLTGTFGGAFRNSGGTRSYPFTYTILAANTWEQKSITIAGDTSGTWLTTNGLGLTVLFSLGSGSTLSGTAGSWSTNNYTSATGATSVVGTNGATFYITGVQLEVGSSATGFEYRQYGTELSLCQRYCQLYSAESKNFGAFINMFGIGSNTTVVGGILQFTPPFRSAPSLTASGSFRASDYNTGYASSTTPTIDSDRTTTTGTEWALSGLSGGITATRPYYVLGVSGGNAKMIFSAEL
jgi:hypothetical protein